MWQDATFYLPIISFYTSSRLRQDGLKRQERMPTWQRALNDTAVFCSCLVLWLFGIKMCSCHTLSWGKKTTTKNRENRVQLLWHFGRLGFYKAKPQFHFRFVIQSKLNGTLDVKTFSEVLQHRVGLLKLTLKHTECDRNGFIRESGIQRTIGKMVGRNGKKEFITNRFELGGSRNANGR